MKPKTIKQQFVRNLVVGGLIGGSIGVGTGAAIETAPNYTHQMEAQDLRNCANITMGGGVVGETCQKVLINANINHGIDLTQEDMLLSDKQKDFIFEKADLIEEKPNQADHTGILITGLSGLFMGVVASILFKQNNLPRKQR